MNSEILFSETHSDNPFVFSAMGRLTEGYPSEVCMQTELYLYKQKLLSQFCLWSLGDAHSTYTCDSAQPADRDICKRRGVKPKSNKSLLLKNTNFDDNVSQLLKIVSTVHSDDMILVTAKEKIELGKLTVNSKKSSYIGVSRNGLNWQALITINKKKTYIGSYETEREAAVAFDFYSLLLHSLTAKTNFNYTKADILGLISNYKANADTLRPEQFQLV